MFNDKINYYYLNICSIFCVGNGLDSNGITGTGGQGGGFLCWRVGDLIELDGWIALRGGDGTGTNAGGGSGGSLLIKTYNMTGLHHIHIFYLTMHFQNRFYSLHIRFLIYKTGHGIIDVRGGDGSGPYGGGGAGGRIGIHCRFVVSTNYLY